MSTWKIIAWTLALCLPCIVVIELRSRRRQRNLRVDKAFNVFMERAHLCETEELDALSIELADYASGLMWNTRKQVTKIACIISFINGRQRQYRAERVGEALRLHALNVSARAQRQAAPPPADHFFTD